jgi:uncharacterized phage protein gp47/JayE
LAYTAPTITAAGLTIPLYSDVLADLIELAKSIYGDDIYLGTDSLDYQFISIFALKLTDAYNTAQLIYSNRSPATAIGSALDAIVKINGLERKSASYSTCQVTLTGIYGTTITGGIVADVAGNSWSLPTPITIPIGSTLTVSATCQTLGAITATVGQISTISTPTQGWTSVTNLVPAVAGQSSEVDSQLRSRQAISTQLPSQSLLGGTIAGIASVADVARYKVYENDTGSTDSNGIPSHSICAVVEGGTDTDIASEIYYRKNGGCGTYGTTSVNISDPTYGTTTTIKFYRPTYVPIFATLGVHPLTGYTTANTTAIQTAVTNYLNSLAIGEELTISALWGVAMSTMPDLTNPVFSLKTVVAGTVIGSQTTSDIVIAFNSVTQGVTANVVVNLV